MSSTPPRGARQTSPRRPRRGARAGPADQRKWPPAPSEVDTDIEVGVHSDSEDVKRELVDQRRDPASCKRLIPAATTTATARQSPPASTSVSPTPSPTSTPSTAADLTAAATTTVSPTMAVTEPPPRTASASATTTTPTTTIEGGPTTTLVTINWGSFDRRLAVLGLRRKDVGGGGDCFFRSFAASVATLGNADKHAEARAATVHTMRFNSPELSQHVDSNLLEKLRCADFDDCCDLMARAGQWVETDAEITSAGEAHNVNVHVLAATGASADNVYLRSILSPAVHADAGDVHVAWDENGHYQALEKVDPEEIVQGIPRWRYTPGAAPSPDAPPRISTQEPPDVAMLSANSCRHRPVLRADDFVPILDRNLKTQPIAPPCGCRGETSHGHCRGIGGVPGCDGQLFNHQPGCKIAENAAADVVAACIVAIPARAFYDNTRDWVWALCAFTFCGAHVPAAMFDAVREEHMANDDISEWMLVFERGEKEGNLHVQSSTRHRAKQDPSKKTGCDCAKFRDHWMNVLEVYVPPGQKTKFQCKKLNTQTPHNQRAVRAYLAKDHEEAHFTMHCQPVDLVTPEDLPVLAAEHFANKDTGWADGKVVSLDKLIGKVKKQHSTDDVPDAKFGNTLLWMIRRNKIVLDPKILTTHTSAGSVLALDRIGPYWEALLNPAAVTEENLATILFGASAVQQHKGNDDANDTFFRHPGFFHQDYHGLTRAEAGDPESVANSLQVLALEKLPYKRASKRRLHYKYADLLPHQQATVRLFKHPPTATQRHIFWFYNLRGRVGKSHTVGYLVQSMGALLISSFEERDVVETIVSCLDSHNGVCPHVPVFDLPYSADAQMNISLVEKLLNGYVNSEKHRSKQLALARFHVTVFSNRQPDTDSLTCDRWSFQLDGETHSSIVDLQQHEESVDAAFSNRSILGGPADEHLAHFLQVVVRDQAHTPVQMPKTPSAEDAHSPHSPILATASPNGHDSDAHPSATPGPSQTSFDMLAQTPGFSMDSFCDND